MGSIKHTINELFEKNPESLVDILIPFLKGKISIVEETKEPHLSTDLVKEKTRMKVLYYLLGKKVVALSFPGIDMKQIGISATDLANVLSITKGQVDGIFHSLKKERFIEILNQDKKQERGRVSYHIPNHKVLIVMEILQTKE